DVALHALGLVDRQPARRGQPAQLLGDRTIRRSRPGAPVDHEDDRIGLGDRLLRLARHLDEHALGRRLEAAGVDGDEAALSLAAFAVVPVARDARQIVDDRVPAARQPVKEGGFADVRTPDKGDDRLHGTSACRLPSSVCTRSPAGSAIGTARTAPPLVSKRLTKAPESRDRKCTYPSKSPMTIVWPSGNGCVS